MSFFLSDWSTRLSTSLDRGILGDDRQDADGGLDKLVGEEDERGGERDQRLKRHLVGAAAQHAECVGVGADREGKAREEVHGEERRHRPDQSENEWRERQRNQPEMRENLGREKWHSLHTSINLRYYSLLLLHFLSLQSTFIIIY